MKQHNVPLQRRLVTFASPPRSFNRPLQGGCYTAVFDRLEEGTSSVPIG
ncbi:MAG: hypothetical protein HC899_30055 [Leptolyngbyaceae cyanobacterium SM1_4_3]|nr:hypothetical protein [Leptolyngbyaceae cyanobacterium SM1_4_3]